MSQKATMSALEEAMADQKVVRITYISSNDTHSERTVEPILFGSTAGFWYLTCWCQLRKAIRWFRLDHIQSATVTSRPCSGHTISEVGQPPEHSRPALPKYRSLDIEETDGPPLGST